MKIAKDKRKHFIACFAISLLVGLQMMMFDVELFVVALAAFYPSLSAGLAKEFADAQWGGTFDLHDLLADVLGGLLGTAIAVLLIVLIN
jgi:VanZ family protein